MPDWGVTILAASIPVLVPVVLRLWTGPHRARQAIKEEAEIVAALPAAFPSTGKLSKRLDRRVREYVLAQTSVGRKLMVGVLSVWVYLVLAAILVEYFRSDYAQWAEPWSEVLTEDVVYGFFRTVYFLSLLAGVAGLAWYLKERADTMKLTVSEGGFAVQSSQASAPSGSGTGQAEDAADEGSAPL